VLLFKHTDLRRHLAVGHDAVVSGEQFVLRDASGQHVCARVDEFERFGQFNELLFEEHDAARSVVERREYGYVLLPGVGDPGRPKPGVSALKKLANERLLAF